MYHFFRHTSSPCGSDVLPWQTWTRHPEDCKDVKFIDIDFPDLMGRKQTTVLSEPQLLQPLTNLETFDTGTVLLKSDQYAQIGCDLRDLKALRVAISEVVDVSTAAFLFVAEVSITYMETEAADALIQWASALGRSEFGLLEQILPDGPGNPFAKTMLSHFDKLSTPLKSVHLYQTLQAQKDRFLSRGWVSVEAWSLWKAWGDITFLSSAERRKLDEVEPFDEWEEFALFASHYCIINARNYPDCRGHNNSSTASAQAPCNGGFPAGDTIDIDDSCGWYTENPGSKGRRRFGALMEMKNRLGEAYYANGLGLGPSSRLSSYDVYHARQPGVQFHEHTVLPAMDGGPSGRMCHTLTSLGAFGTLLVGGRTSPGSALKDCWLFMEGENRWKRTYDLPVPLYRHSIARLGTSSFALLMGGKTGSLSVFDGCLLFHPDKGWIDVRIMPKEGELWSPVFGANLCLDDIPVKRQTDGSYKWEGYLAGGIGSDGLIADQILLWEMEFTDSMADVSIFPAYKRGEENRADKYSFSVYPLDSSPELRLQARTVSCSTDLAPCASPFPATPTGRHLLAGLSKIISCHMSSR
jgi:tRNA wybutosine-synthesizing protein 4